MTGEIGAAGDLATGVVWAQAVDDGGAMSRHRDAGGRCLNCETVLTGAYCHACGQSAHVHKTLASIGHDVLHGAFHFEGRILRTLPMLIRDPGGLTRRYIAGERMRFVQPLTLFLFGTFLMFAAIHLVGPNTFEFGEDFRATSSQVTGIDAQIAEQRATLARSEALPATDPHRADTIAAAHAALRSLKIARRLTGDGAGPITGWPKLDDRLNRVRADPALALYEFQANAYKFSWALIPISTPLVALLFLWRRRFTLYDHAIFTTYSLDFMLLLLTALMLAGAAGLPGWLVTLGLFVAPPVHMFAQLRGAYGLRRRSALWRTAALAVLSATALTVFLTLLVALGIAG